jgi:hypothetical protein
MKMTRVWMALLVGIVVLGIVQAQSAPAGKSLAATLGVYVFPNAGQDASQQSKDEGECYNWAVQQVGVDPFQAAEQAKAQQAQAAANAEAAKAGGKGAGARGAVKGAAAGALVGEIASDDAGEGAAIGAAAGVVAGRSRARRAGAGAEAEAQAQTQQIQQATKEQTDAFKKAFSVCLESKKYMVKF